MKKIILTITVVIGIITCVVLIKIRKNNGIIVPDRTLQMQYKDIDLNKISIDELNELLNEDLYSKGYTQEEINDLDHVLYAKKAYKEYTRYSKHIKKDATADEQKFLLDVFYGRNYASEVNFNNVLFEMCKKNGDWSLYPLSNDVYKQYNEKDGLLGKDTFDTIELDLTGDMTDTRIKVKTTNSDGSFLYTVNCDETHTSFEDEGRSIIDNIIVKKFQISDNNGNEIDIRQIFDNEHVKSNFEELCRDGEKRLIEGYEWDGTYHGDSIAVSDNFRKKYPYFLDLFIHYSPLEYNEITLKDLNAEKQIAMFEVDSILECKRRTYEVKYKLTDDLYLDDVVVKLLKEEEIEAKLNNYNFPLIFYKNTDWIKYRDVINYNEKFYDKYKENCSYFQDIDLIDVDNFNFEIPYFNTIKINDDKPGSIVSYMLRDNKINFYYWKVIRDKDGKLEDYVHIKLPYTNISIEEVKEKFLADKELQKELGININ